MESKINSENQVAIKKWALLISGGWLLLCLLLLFVLFRDHNRHHREWVTAVARTNINKDLALRFWSAQHGGVYVPETRDTPANPYLKDVNERDVITPSGKRLTLMNPAYILRQMMSDFNRVDGIRGHLTSQKLTNPINKPDDWEAKVLKKFEKNKDASQEFVEVEQQEGGEYLRLMKPLITKESCLKCHGKQGYKVGDIRGGISLTLSLDRYEYLLLEDKRNSFAICMLLIILGQIFIFWGYRFLIKMIEKRDSLLKSDFSRELNKILYSLLQTSLKKQPLDQLLEESLDTILTTPLMDFKPKGSIFLKDPYKDEIILSTYRRLAEPLHSKCAIIKYGQCLCGQAAEEKKVIFSAHIDERHSVTFDGIEDHGHYCIPIISSEMLLGVLNVYVGAHHQKNEKEVNFLQAIADCLAGIIERKQSETKIQQAQDERNLLQAELIQSAKLASIGTLASGVAHELNNPLTSIIGNVHLLEKEHKDSTSSFPKLEKVLKASLRMKSIIDHLRSFSRKSKREDWKKISLSTPINNAIEMLQSNITLQNISINLSFNDALHSIWGDDQQLESVFQNLITNSQDSFKDITDNRNKVISIETNFVDGKVQVIYQDNANGIPLEIKARVFDPFFTTKKQGEGTGLGMSISKNILAQHKATIVLESDPGEGSKFILHFPLDRRAEARDEETDDQQLSKGEESQTVPQEKHVLTVDDEEDVTDVVEAFLEEHYTVTAKNDPMEAIELIKKQNFDLVLTDMKMPTASGLDILFATKEFQSNTPVVIMSGFDPKEADIQHALAHGAKAYLAKPFSDPDELISLVSSCLD